MHTFGIWLMTVQTGGIRVTLLGNFVAIIRCLRRRVAVIPFRLHNRPDASTPAVNNERNTLIFTPLCFPPLARRNGVIGLTDRFTCLFFPLRDHRFDEVLLLGLDLFHVQANSLLGFLFG